MESVIRALFVYTFLLVIFRIAGRRTLAESTNFELVMLLIISETTQQAMVDGDHSTMNAVVLIITLVGTSLIMGVLKQHFPLVERLLDGVPVLLMENGRLHKERMDQARVDEEDIMEAARELRGLERMDQIKYVILERNGQLTVIPR